MSDITTSPHTTMRALRRLQERHHAELALRQISSAAGPSPDATLIDTLALAWQALRRYEDFKEAMNLTQKAWVQMLPPVVEGAVPRPQTAPFVGEAHWTRDQWEAATLVARLDAARAVLDYVEAAAAAVPTDRERIITLEKAVLAGDWVQMVDAADVSLLQDFM